MRTQLSLTQRTQNGRWLYGRASNYRLRPCLLSLPNFSGARASVDPATGDTPLDVDGDLTAITVPTLTPGIQSDWPAPAAGGMSSPLVAGGIAAQANGYPRVAGGAAIAMTYQWDFGDGAGFVAATGLATEHEYEDAGAFSAVFRSIDALGRVQDQVIEVLAGQAIPASLVAPVVSGTPEPDEVLSTTNGTWANNPTSFTYQWQLDGVDIPDETDSTYTVVVGDIGSDVRCVVTATNSFGNSLPANSNALTITA